MHMVKENDFRNCSEMYRNQVPTFRRESNTVRGGMGGYARKIFIICGLVLTGCLCRDLRLGRLVLMVSWLEGDCPLEGAWCRASNQALYTTLAPWALNKAYVKYVTY
jgi:hypothetical protein